MTSPVIGAGSAGFSAANTAAKQGAHVALIDHGTIGGTCVNTGCVPSKTLIRTAESIYQAKAASRFNGIAGEARVTDWHAVLQHKDELVGSLRRAKYMDLLPAYHTIAHIEGKAGLDNGGIAVDCAPLEAGKVIITTGASPALPPIPGMDAALAPADQTRQLRAVDRAVNAGLRITRQGNRRLLHVAGLGSLRLQIRCRRSHVDILVGRGRLG